LVGAKASNSTFGAVIGFDVRRPALQLPGLGLWHVVHLTGGGSFSMDALYADFTARLVKAAAA
jgi:hypothetical protein